MRFIRTELFSSLLGEQQHRRGAPQSPNDTLGHRGQKQQPLWRARRLLISAHGRLSERGNAKLRGLPTASAPCGEVRLAWHAKKTHRGLYDIDYPQLAGAYPGDSPRT